MNIIDTGIDLIEYKSIKVTDLILKRILHVNEISELKKLKSTTSKKQFLASRWALKEAIYKSSQLTVNFADIEIVKNKINQPQYKGNESTFKLSLSHTKNYVVAISIYLKK